MYKVTENKGRWFSRRKREWVWWVYNNVSATSSEKSVWHTLPLNCGLSLLLCNVVRAITAIMMARTFNSKEWSHLGLSILAFLPWFLRYPDLGLHQFLDFVMSPLFWILNNAKHYCLARSMPTMWTDINSSLSAYLSAYPIIILNLCLVFTLTHT